MLTSSELRRQALEWLRKGELRHPEKPAEPSIQPASSEEEIPLSCGQQQVWLGSELASGAPIYNESVTVRKSGPLDPAVLESCFNEIVRRHAIWRTALLNFSGNIRQVVLPQIQVPLPLIDLSHLSSREALAAAIRLASEDASQPFDLNQPPLLRARLVRLAPDDHRLYLTFHRLVFDCVSLYRALLPELAALYRAFSAGQPSPLPDLPIQYGDYAFWQQRKLARGDYAAQVAYWREALGDEAPLLELPIAKPRIAAPTWQGGMETFAMPAELSRAVKQFSATEGATLYMTLLASFHVLLYRYSGQEQITTGGVVSTRNRPELKTLVGLLLNTVVLRSHLHSSLSFSEVLNQIKDKVLGALANSDVPFETVVRELGSKRDSSGNTLFQILFSLRPASADLSDTWELSELDVHSGASGFDLFLEVIEQPASLTGRFVYASDLFERPAIARMIAHWQKLLEAVVENPGLPIGRLPLLTDDERQTMSSAGAASSVELPPATITPSRSIDVQELPLTPNGTLNRKALPDSRQGQPAGGERTAPRNDTERRVAALWATLLTTPVPDIHEDFFRLGGHSLLAAELSRRIDAEFGKRLSLSAIFEAPTVAGLSALLDSVYKMGNSSGVFDSHADSEQRRLYWIYGGACFRALASHLRPAYRLHEVWLDQELEKTICESDRLEDVARLIVAGMRSNPSRGPYDLGGWCIAGILAYEVAVQLEAAGEEVGLVALLGAPNPQHYTATSTRDRLKSKLLYHWNKMTRLDLAGVSRYLIERARYQVKAHNPAQSREFNRILLELALRYEPKPLRARVALFQGKDRPSVVDYAQGWTGVVKGEFAAYDIPGNHETSLEEPNVVVLAEKLRDCLR